MPKVATESRRWAVSAASQANYQTVTPPGAGDTPPAATAPFLFLLSAPGDEALADYNVENIDDKGASTGSDFATEQVLIKHDVSVPRKLRLTSYWLGWINFFLMGQVTTVNGPGGSTNAKKHTSTPIDKRTNMQLPAFTYVEEANASVHRVQYPSCVIEQCTVRGGGGAGRLAFLEADLVFRGSGKRLTNVTVNFVHASAQHVFYPTALQYFLNSQATLTIDDNGSPIAIGCDYLEFEMNYRNSLLADEGYLPGCAQYQTAATPTSGAVRSELLIGNREIELRYKAYLQDSAAHYIAALQDQRPLMIEQKFEGATIAGGTDKHTAYWKAFLTKYSAAKSQFENGLLVVDVTPKLLQDGSGNTLSSYAINTTASYS